MAAVHLTTSICELKLALTIVEKIFYMSVGNKKVGAFYLSNLIFLKQYLPVIQQGTFTACKGLKLTVQVAGFF